MNSKFYLFLTLLLSIAFTTLFTQCSEDKDMNESQDKKCAAAIDNIMTRTSIRAYTDEEVSNSDIETMLRAAMAAPTAGNKQPWRFIVVKNRAILDSIAANFNSMKMTANAPLAIVVCGVPNETFEGEGVGYWIQDTSAATENLLLAAHALGLGAVWCGITPISERMEKLSEMLNIPEGVVPLNVIAIGHPDQDPAPKDKWKPENITTIE